MTKPFAVVLGLCFAALGLGRLFLSSGREGVYGVGISVLFVVAGIACFLSPFDRA